MDRYSQQLEEDFKKSMSDPKFRRQFRKRMPTEQQDTRQVFIAAVLSILFVALMAGLTYLAVRYL